MLSNSDYFFLMRSCLVPCFLFFFLFIPPIFIFFFFSSRRRHTRFDCDWSSDVCSSDSIKTPVTGDIISAPAQSQPRPWIIRRKFRARAGQSSRRRGGGPRFPKRTELRGGSKHSREARV